MREWFSKLRRLERAAGLRSEAASPLVEAVRSDPCRVLESAGITPDAWQADLLRSPAERVLLLCSRQAGKSTVAAALAVVTALTKPGSPILLLSPTLRQSGELFRKVLDLYQAVGCPVRIRARSALRLELVNGSRVVSLPGTEGTIRGFSGVSLLVIDEAARVADPLYFSVRPMLAVSQGRMVALSTPFGQRGWFHDSWTKDPAWGKVRITAPECPRIPPEFLASERKALGERWFRQEYMCSFEDTIDAVFAAEDIRAALCDDVKPLFGGNP